MLAKWYPLKVWLPMLALISLAPAADAIEWHPSDGPDTDVHIRIESDAVVFNIVMNLAFVDAVVEVPREDEMAVHPVEEEALRAALVDLYRELNRVAIDGLEVAPLDADFEVLPPDLSLLPLFPRMGAKALIKVRLVLEYPAKSPPQQVAMLWGPYPEDVVMAAPEGEPTIEVKARLLSEGVDSLVTFKAAEPEFTWHATGHTLAERFLAVPEPAPPARIHVPVLAAICWGLLIPLLVLWRRRRGRRRAWAAAIVVLSLLGTVGLRGWSLELPDPFRRGVELPDAIRALEIFRPLHANIYRAFDYHRESDVYDALARSVSGDLLASLYDEIYRSLILQDQGGAVSRVQAVRLVDTEVEEIGLLPPEGRPGFRIRARWQVDGAVFHWGHSHFRTNEYLARYTVFEGADGWRIAGSQILEQLRVSSSPGPG